VKTVTPEQLARIREGSTRDLEQAARHRAGLKRIG
jgi:hypothetical protein